MYESGAFGPRFFWRGYHIFQFVFRSICLVILVYLPLLCCLRFCSNYDWGKECSRSSPLLPFNFFLALFAVNTFGKVLFGWVLIGWCVLEVYSIISLATCAGVRSYFKNFGDWTTAPIQSISTKSILYEAVEFVSYYALKSSLLALLETLLAHRIATRYLNYPPSPAAVSFFPFMSSPKMMMNFFMLPPISPFTQQSLVVQSYFSLTTITSLARDEYFCWLNNEHTHCNWQKEHPQQQQILPLFE